MYGAWLPDRIKLGRGRSEEVIEKEGMRSTHMPLSKSGTTFPDSPSVWKEPDGQHSDRCEIVAGAAETEMKRFMEQLSIGPEN